MQSEFNELLTVTFTLFAVIDIVGSIPLLLSLKKKMGGIKELKATLISGGLMILFLYLGEPFLHILGSGNSFVCRCRLHCNFYSRAWKWYWA